MMLCDIREPFKTCELVNVMCSIKKKYIVIWK